MQCLKTVIWELSREECPFPSPSEQELVSQLAKVLGETAPDWWIVFPKLTPAIQGLRDSQFSFFKCINIIRDHPQDVHEGYELQEAAELGLPVATNIGGGHLNLDQIFKSFPFPHQWWDPNRNKFQTKVQDHLIPFVKQRYGGFPGLVNVLGTDFLDRYMVDYLDVNDDWVWWAVTSVMIQSVITWKMDASKQLSRQGMKERKERKDRKQRKELTLLLPSLENPNRGSALVKGMVAIALFGFYPDDERDGYGKVTGSLLIKRSLFKSNGAGVRKGAIPIYALAKEGLFYGDKHVGAEDPLKLMRAEIPDHLSVDRMLGLWRRGDYVAFYSKFQLQGEDLFTFMKRARDL